MRRSMVVLLLCFCLCAGAVLSCGGCVSVGNSPDARFYMLDSPVSVQGSGDQISGVPDGTVISVGPVKIPAYLARPQIVTRDRNKRLVIAQFDRWGESLDAAMARRINEELAGMFPTAVIETFPWNFFVSVRYQVIVELLDWDARLDENLGLVVQWSVLDVKAKDVVMTKRSAFNEPIGSATYEGLTDALSVAMTSLSRQIAEAVAGLAGKAGE
ncbi:MAG: PqiC family protein [Candidatus Omnitrophica bacterium]|nr:PqiC family protein [Candidatus Omnitrophota bacterium]MDD5573617.1 PqiC family protein [Candidatus Omnitrophota bacterium]